MTRILFFPISGIFGAHAVTHPDDRFQPDQGRVAALHATGPGALTFCDAWSTVQCIMLRL
jgi:hypothetical protein